MTNHARHIPTPARAPHQSGSSSEAHLFFGTDRDGKALCLTGPVACVLIPFHARRNK